MMGRWRFIEGAGSLGVLAHCFGVVGEGGGKEGCSRHEERGGSLRGSSIGGSIGLEKREEGVSHDRGGVTDKLN